jgi:hypothetical protein
MRRVVFAAALNTACFSEPQPDNKIEDATSTGAEDSEGSDETTPQPDFGVDDEPECAGELCVAAVVTNIAITGDFDEHVYPCPAPDIEIAWLYLNDVIRTARFSCGEPPLVVDIDKMPTGWRVTAGPDCMLEQLDAHDPVIRPDGVAVFRIDSPALACPEAEFGPAPTANLPYMTCYTSLPPRCH